MISIMQAARYLVYLSYEKKRSILTPLKLQKVLYLAQGWSYVWDNSPLFIEDFCAWQYGPVNLQIYNYFQKYGRNVIPYNEGSANIVDYDSKSTLEAVWDQYSLYSAYDLVELTHSHDIWKSAYYNNTIISKEDIKQYFQATYL